MFRRLCGARSHKRPQNWESREGIFTTPSGVTRSASSVTWCHVKSDGQTWRLILQGRVTVHGSNNTIRKFWHSQLLQASHSSCLNIVYKSFDKVKYIIFRTTQILIHKMYSKNWTCWLHETWIILNTLYLAWVGLRWGRYLHIYSLHTSMNLPKICSFSGMNFGVLDKVKKRGGGITPYVEVTSVRLPETINSIFCVPLYIFHKFCSYCIYRRSLNLTVLLSISN